MGIDAGAKTGCCFPQLTRLDMKVDLSVEDVDVTHGRGEYGQHGIDILSLFSPQR
jgi:hypothetical protein